MNRSKKTFFIIPIILASIIFFALKIEKDVKITFEVVIDQSKEQVYSPFDTGYSGLSQFTRFLYGVGATVSLNFLPLTEFLSTYKGPGKILFLGVSMLQKYSTEEIEAIKSFLETGGGVLAIVEHDNFFNNLDFQNPLIEEFGIKGLNGQALAFEKGWDEAIWPNCISPTLNIENIFLYLPAPLETIKPASTVLRVKNPYSRDFDSVGAFSTYKNGRVVVLGDMEIFWNMSKNAGIRKKNNQKFLKTVFEYLKNNGQNLNLIPRFKKHSAPKGNILFYTGGDSLSPHNSPSGLSKFGWVLNNSGFNIETGKNIEKIERFDLVVIAVPVSPLNNFKKLFNAKKLLLISDGQSDFFAKDREKKQRIFGQDLKLDLDFGEYQNPLNPILDLTDLEIYPGTLIAPGDNHFLVKGLLNNKVKFVAKRSGVLTSKKDLANEFEFKDAYVLEEFVPNSPDKKDGEPFSKVLKENNLNAYSLMVKTNKFLVISDLEILSNQFFESESSAEFLKIFYQWLGIKS